MARFIRFFRKLAYGDSDFPIIFHKKRYLIISAVIIATSLALVFIKGFSLGIDFSGGTQISLPASEASTDQAINRVFQDATSHIPKTIQHVGSGSASSVVIRSESLSTPELNRVRTGLFNAIHPRDSNNNPNINAISSSDVSASWGAQITHKALWALLIFLVVISVYIVIRFEWEMAVAALISLIFDLSVTAGIYSLIGLEVAPSTVVGLLTIMGFSLYDTVVVFDKVKENTARLADQQSATYAELANKALNQTLMRSINTTIISVLPIISLLIVAVKFLGVGTLKDLGTVQLVGVTVGAFSSIFLATPVLVLIKERGSNIAKHTNRVLKKRAKSK